ncbi:MAG TPA: septum formation initiator family protein [Nitrospira sp.]|nr:septum formation initiator family protein [Nitrospira sp.]
MIIKQNRGRQWLDWRRRMLTGAQYAGVAACLLLLIALCFGEMGLPGYVAMRERAQQLEIEIQELQRATRVLRTDIDRLEHDPLKIEQLARERLGYVRKGETVYQLIPDPRIGPGPRP